MPRYQFPRERREKISLTVVSLIVLLLVAGLVKLQIFEYSSRVEQSEKNSIRTVPIVPRRGLVYDREGRIVIDNRPSYTVAVVPAETTTITLPNLSQLFQMDTSILRQRIQKNMISRYQPALVKRDVPFEAIAVLEEQAWRFPGVDIQIDQVRKYPKQLGTESFTGYVGEVSLEDLSNGKSKDYRLGSMIGKKGLEKQYDRFLRGREGTVYKEVAASGQVIGIYSGKDPEPAVPGNDLVLTIDIDLQRACEQALDTFCCGAVVAIDPRNGEILAMASYPGYDANMFSSVIPESLWQAIASDSTFPLLNRPMKGLYPPGSTVKPVTVGAALQEGIITAYNRLQPCTGGFRFGNRVFRCWESAGHGRLTAAHALEQSCDVFMYQIGLKLGIDKLSYYYAQCGFGRPTGIDLPGELSGLNPNRHFYDSTYGKHQWTQGVTLNLSIGQGELLVTPLQLAQFYCGLANNGVVYRPHLVKAIVSPEGDTTVITPETSFTLPFSRSTLKVLMEGMRLVVEGEHGTARFLRNDRYSIGGKTGTVENPHGENHSLFVGVAPLEAPEIVVCVLVENAGHGSEVAAPVAGKIIKAYMEKKSGLATLTEGNDTEVKQ
jgi:penicillin-binding protein 2